MSRGMEARIQISLLGIDVLMHDFSAREGRRSDGGKAAEVKNLASVGGLAHGFDFEDGGVLTGDVGGDGSGIEGLAAALHVENGGVGDEGMFDVGGVFEEGLVRVWEGGDGYDGEDFGGVEELVSILLIDEFGWFGHLMICQCVLEHPRRDT